MGFIERLQKIAREEKENEAIKQMRITEEERRRKEIRAENVLKAKQQLELSGLPKLVNDMAKVIGGRVKTTSDIIKDGTKYISSDQVLISLTWDFSDFKEFHDFYKEIGIEVFPDGKIEIVSYGRSAQDDKSRFRTFKTSASRLHKHPEQAERQLELFYSNAYPNSIRVHTVSDSAWQRFLNSNSGF